MPVLVLQVAQILELTDLLEIRRQLQKFPVLCPIAVGILVGLNLQPILWIHQEITAQVIEHDRVP